MLIVLNFEFYSAYLDSSEFKMLSCKCASVVLLLKAVLTTRNCIEKFKIAINPEICML